MVDDVYDILTAVSTTAEGATAMCTEHTVSALCHAVANRCCRMFALCLADLISLPSKKYRSQVCSDSLGF